MKRYSTGLLALAIVMSTPLTASSQTDRRGAGTEGRLNGDVSTVAELDRNGSVRTDAEDDRYLEIGFASWYHKGFHGRRTASGEIYDHGAMTAAHPSLPFNTLVRLTRTDTGHSVVVRINDRMGAEPRHIIDVSGAAAEKMDMMTSGIAHVEVRIVASDEADRRDDWRRIEDDIPVKVVSDRPTTRGWAAQRSDQGRVDRPVDPNRPVSATEMPVYTLQIGAFHSPMGAREMRDAIPEAWIREEQKDSGTSYKVFFGRYQVEEAARKDQKRLWEMGRDSFLRKMTP